MELYCCGFHYQAVVRPNINMSLKSPYFSSASKDVHTMWQREVQISNASFQPGNKLPAPLFHHLPNGCNKRGYSISQSNSKILSTARNFRWNITSSRNSLAMKGFLIPCSAIRPVSHFVHLVQRIKLEMVESSETSRKTSSKTSLLHFMINTREHALWMCLPQELRCQFCRTIIDFISIQRYPWKESLDFYSDQSFYSSKIPILSSTNECVQAFPDLLIWY